MTTSSWSTVVDHSSDAGFRAWGSDLNTQLTAVGLVQTADTGQVNWVSVTRPAISTVGGYEIWRFVDSTLFLKIEYGTGTIATNPQMWITVGTGSNGSGTITGQTSTRAIFTANSAPTSTVTNYTSRLCRIADALALSWKEGFSGTGAINGGFLVIGKTVDGTGAATTTGFGVLRSGAAGGAGGISLQSVRTVATAVTFNDTVTCALIPGVPTSSTVGGVNTQAYALWLNTPDVTPFAWANLIIISEEPRGTSFVVAMVGAITHTFCSTGQICNTALNSLAAASYGCAFIFE